MRIDAPQFLTHDGELFGRELLSSAEIEPVGGLAVVESVVFTLDNNYPYYLVTYDELIPDSKGDDFALQFSEDGGETFIGSGYGFTGYTFNSAGIEETQRSNNWPRIRLVSVGVSSGLGKAQGATGCCLISNTSAEADTTATTELSWRTKIPVDILRYWSGGGALYSPTVVNAIRFQMAGSLFLFGKFWLWGLR